MAATDTSKPGDELIITTHGRNYGVPENNHAIVVNLGSDDFLRNSLKQVRTYVETYGALKKLTLVGHGDVGEMVSEKNPADSQSLIISHFLEGLKKIQKDLRKKDPHAKIADRIVFDACQTLTYLKPIAVDYLRHSAKELGAEIVGAITPIYYKNKDGSESTPGLPKIQKETGLMVQFAPDGSVRKDPTSASASAVAYESEVSAYAEAHKGQNMPTARADLLRTKVTASEAGLEGKYHSEWFACHEGNSQAEGAACQINLLPKERPGSRDMKKIKAAPSAKVVQDGRKPVTPASADAGGRPALAVPHA